MPLEDQNLRSAESAPGAPLPGAVDAALAGIQALPEDTLILIPTRNLVLFPGTVLPITLGRQRTIAAAQAAIRLSRPIGLLLQRDPARVSGAFASSILSTATRFSPRVSSGCPRSSRPTRISRRV